MSGSYNVDILLIGGVVIFIALIAYVFLHLPPDYASRSWPRLTRTTHVAPAQRIPTDARFQLLADQLRAVSTARFSKRKLLGTAEYGVFKIIEDDITAARRGYRVFAQTSLGEILTSRDEEAFYSINSKRVDILIVDRGGWPVAAVEFQGTGHYRGTAAGRDAVKKEALRKAGVPYIEVTAADNPDQIRYRVREQLGWRNDARRTNDATGARA